jgi:hypothetical protein
MKEKSKIKITQTTIDLKLAHFNGKVVLALTKVGSLDYQRVVDSNQCLLIKGVTKIVKNHQNNLLDITCCLVF